MRKGSLAAALATSLAGAYVGYGCAVASATPALVAPIAYGGGAKADVRLGIAAATVAELADVPTLLLEPGSQAFVGDTFARLESVATEAALRARFVSLRERFRLRRHFARQTATDYQAAVVALLQALPAPRDRLFLLGNLAQQAVYNARVLRETAADDEFRKTIGTLDAADATFAGLAARRARLAALESDRWDDSTQHAREIVVALLGSDDSVAFPAMPRIWTILARSRHVAGRDAPHLAIEIVWFDGHRDTYAAYPDGDAFDRDASRMTCRRNREPSRDNGHATSLVPPSGGSYDRMATAFDRACDAFTSKAPQYRVAENSDDRFIAAMLTYAGIDPGVVRGR